MGTSTPTVIRLGDYLTEQIPRFRQALEQGEANEAHLKALLEEQKIENGKIRRTLSVMAPDDTPSKQSRRGKPQPSHIGQTRRNGTATGHGITAEAAERYVNEMLRRLDEGEKFFSQRDIYETLGADQSPSSAAFRFLRDINFLRKAGRFDDGKPGRRRAERWTVMDRDAYTKFMNEQTNDNNGGVAA